MRQATMAGPVERLADRWFRGWGVGALVALAATVVALLVGYEGWRLPFVLAHLAALLALFVLKPMRAAYTKKPEAGLAPVLAQ